MVLREIYGIHLDALERIRRNPEEKERVIEETKKKVEALLYECRCPWRELRK